MRPDRMTIVLILIALGALGAWFGVRAQERRQPAPTVAREAYSSSLVQSAIPTPSSAPISYEQEASPSEEAKSRTIDSATPIPTSASDPSEAPKLPVLKDEPSAAAEPTIVVPEMTEGLAQASSVAAKLPAELPEQPQKSEAKPPVAAPTPELLAPPKKRLDASAAKKPAAEKPASESNNLVPPAPLPQFIEPSPVVAPPPAPVPSVPKTEASGSDKQTPPPAGIHAKPLAPKAEPKQTIVVPPSIIDSKPTVEPNPIVVAPPVKAPDIAVPALPQLPVAPPVIVTPPEAQLAPAPIISPPAKTQEPRKAPARPPAFLLVKPRRSAAAPQPALPAPGLPAPGLPPLPSPSASALIDQPRTYEAPLASSVAQVTVEKRGPTVLRQGALATYQIIVRNRGAAASGPVTVFDEIPRLAKLVTGAPAPSQLGDKAIWTLPPLPANSESILRLDLRATGTGEFVGNTTVFMSAATATTRATIQRDPTAKTVSAGPLGIQVRAPAGGAVGQPVAFEIQITNQSKQTLTDLVLHAKLGDGFTHPSGNNIEADVGDLAAGASKTFNMPATAVRAGRQTVEVKITATGGVEAEAQATVPITSNGLSIQLAPTTRLLLDRDGDVRIDVTNHQAESLRNVVIADTLPESLQYVAASDRGIYQASTRTVQWLIDYLPPGETRSVSVRLQGKTPGSFPKEVSARAETLPDTRAQTVVHVEGYSDLVLIVTPRDQPLELGKETVCEVRVQNFGNVAAGNVQIQVELPAGVRAGYIQGPTGHRVQGRTLWFEPIARLAARSQAVYHVGAIAQAEGDLRIRAQVVSDQTRAPVTREAALVVYRDR